MKANLIVEINEITIRHYSIIEEEGLLTHVKLHPELSFEYEEDEEEPDKHVLIVKGKSLDDLLTFLSSTELLVKIIK